LEGKALADTHIEGSLPAVSKGMLDEVVAIIDPANALGKGSADATGR
jgi:hypothetical protein